MSSPRTLSSGQSEVRLGGVVNAITRPARSWNGGSPRHSVEFHTLHLHLQQWKPGIWHTTPIPAGARRLHTEEWNSTLKHFWPLHIHVSAHWFERNRETKNDFAVFLQLHDQQTFATCLYTFSVDQLCVFCICSVASHSTFCHVLGNSLNAFVYLMLLLCLTVTDINVWMRFSYFWSQTMKFWSHFGSL